MNSTLSALLLSTAAVAQTTAPAPAVSAAHFPPGVHQVVIPSVPHVRADLLQHITPIVEQAIADGAFPGAVVLATHRGRTIYRGIFGHRRILPDAAPMRYDTIFDMASLTKVMATTPAIMQLLERGRLRLDDPLASYWPEFGQNGKQVITIRELLTHFSGLPPDIPSPELLELLHLPPTGFPGQPPDKRVDTPWSGQASALAQVTQVALVDPPGTKCVYSDINFLVLGYLVERLSGESLDVYTRRHIYEPLGMSDTGFLPPASQHDRIAPTEYIGNELRWGVVHDPTAKAMGGVSGLAGLFSTAGDTARYAECLLHGGELPAAGRHIRALPGDTRAEPPARAAQFQILSPLTVVKMTTPQTPLDSPDVRGLGWDLDSAYSSNRGVLFPAGSYGHTGWTGTSIWIDPLTETYLIILTSRVHPHAAPGPGIARVRAQLADIVAASLTDVPAAATSNTGSGERTRAYAH